MQLVSQRCPLSLLTLLIGVSGALLIMVPQEPIQGAVGESVLLPVTYSIARPPGTLRVIWSHQMSIIVFSEMTLCHQEPPTPRRPRKVCHEYNIVVEKYQQRVMYFPENASLLLWDLQLNDSGQYTVTFQELNQSRSLTLAVSEPETTHKNPDSTQFTHRENAGIQVVLSLTVRFLCAAIFFLLILGLHCAWWRQA